MMEQIPQVYIDQKRSSRMNSFDSMSPEMRSVVNDYGFHVVNTCLQLGVSKPRQIRHLVEIILDEFSPTRGSKSSQGIRTEVVQHLKGDF